MSSDRAESRKTEQSQPGSNDEQSISDQRYEGYPSERNEQPGDDTPDVVLDVPVLNVDEIDLEVEDLKAHVSLRAELADLVKVNVGVDVYLGKVKLEIKGVEAQALLKVKLERILSTLDRALEAIEKSPQILNETARDVEQTANRAEDEAARTVQRAVDESGNATDTTPSESGGVEDEEVASSLSNLQIEEEYVDEEGRIVGRAVDESGNIVEEILDEEGNFQDGTEEAEGPEDDGEVEATDAARRKAQELGVRLSEVKGTGSGGRILVGDVEKATR